MGLASFLRQLTERSSLAVEGLSTGDGDLAEAEAVLQEMAEQFSLELACNAPALSLPAAIWGARLLHRGCQFIVFREEGAPALKEALGEPCPQPRSPSVFFSIDLSFRFLPDLIRLARAASADDPLIPALMGLARAWPLSSVGVRGLGAVDVAAFWSDRCLRQLYVDRILDTRDASRLAEPCVRCAVRAALGLHLELAGDIANQLEGSIQP